MMKSLCSSGVELTPRHTAHWRINRLDIAENITCCITVQWDGQAIDALVARRKTSTYEIMVEGYEPYLIKGRKLSDPTSYITATLAYLYDQSPPPVLLEKIHPVCTAVNTYAAFWLYCTLMRVELRPAPARTVATCPSVYQSWGRLAVMAAWLLAQTGCIQPPLLEVVRLPAIKPVVVRARSSRVKSEPALQPVLL